jgi:hypothetical protein
MSIRIKNGKILMRNGKIAFGADGSPCTCCGGASACTNCETSTLATFYSSYGWLSGAPLEINIDTEQADLPKPVPFTTEVTVHRFNYSASIDYTSTPDAVDNVDANYSAEYTLHLQNYAFYSETHTVAGDFFSYTSPGWEPAVNTLTHNTWPASVTEDYSGGSFYALTDSIDPLDPLDTASAGASPRTIEINGYAGDVYVTAYAWSDGAYHCDMQNPTFTIAANSTGWIDVVLSTPILDASEVSIGNRVLTFKLKRTLHGVIAILPSADIVASPPTTGSISATFSTREVNVNHGVTPTGNYTVNGTTPSGAAVSQSPAFPPTGAIPIKWGVAYPGKRVFTPGGFTFGPFRASISCAAFSIPASTREEMLAAPWTAFTHGGSNYKWHPAWRDLSNNVVGYRGNVALTEGLTGTPGAIRKKYLGEVVISFTASFTTDIPVEFDLSLLGDYTPELGERGFDGITVTIGGVPAAVARVDNILTVTPANTGTMAITGTLPDSWRRQNYTTKSFNSLGTVINSGGATWSGVLDVWALLYAEGATRTQNGTGAFSGLTLTMVTTPSPAGQVHDKSPLYATSCQPPTKVYSDECLFPRPGESVQACGLNKREVVDECTVDFVVFGAQEYISGEYAGKLTNSSSSTLQSWTFTESESRSGSVYLDFDGGGDPRTFSFSATATRNGNGAWSVSVTGTVSSGNFPGGTGADDISAQQMAILVAGEVTTGWQPQTYITHYWLTARVNVNYSASDWLEGATLCSQGGFLFHESQNPGYVGAAAAATANTANIGASRVPTFVKYADGVSQEPFYLGERWTGGPVYIYPPSPALKHVRVELLDFADNKGAQIDYRVYETGTPISSGPLAAEMTGLAQFYTAYPGTFLGAPVSVTVSS